MLDGTGRGGQLLVWNRGFSRHDAVEASRENLDAGVGTADDGFMPEPSGASEPSDVAGASAQREYERRKANRERRQDQHEAAVRDRHPRVGGLILAVQGTPQAPRHETVWARGAEGEAKVAKALAERCPTVPVLHDRRIPRSKANIDHIAVARSGVWVIDTKRYKGKVEVMKPWLGDASLKVGGRNKANLLEGLAKQVQLVKTVVQSSGLEVPVHGCLCFVDAEWPTFGKPKPINGLRIFWPKLLAQTLNEDGPLTPEGAAHLVTLLESRFRAA